MSIWATTTNGAAGRVPDYRLEALGNRSFEHLIQSLSSFVLGFSITPFGDGPDGGREATFDGLVNYPSPQGPWNGYGVIQAKFLQRPKSADSDGKWALRQLRDELEQFEASSSQRQMPEYYIFATNAVLSPGADGGKKDAVVETLSTFADRNNLRGFDVWDYDKIRTFLDRCPEVRVAYDAWIMPGDVLAAVIKRLNGLQPDFTSVMTRFLARELLDNQYAGLEQAGHTADTQIPLARVFVDIPFSRKQSIDEDLEGESACVIAQLLEGSCSAG